MDNKIDTLIVGATYFGIGYASVHPECTIIEASQMLGGDFHHSERTADVSNIGDQETATDLGKMMQENQVWEDGKFDVLKASPVIHKFVSETASNPHILLDARIITIEIVEDGYVVKYVDNEGVHNVYCGKVLDTTVCRDTYPNGANCTCKTLNVFTVSVADGIEEKLRAVCPECEIVDGKNEGEKIVKFPFKPEVKMLVAYRHVTDLWKRAFPEAEERILFIAEDFEYTCEEIKDEAAPCPWNGVKYSNPLTAFVEGMKYQFV